MCGIIGILSVKEYNIASEILVGLSYMENRGYDSSGIFLYNNKEIDIYRKIFDNNIKPIEQLGQYSFQDGYIGFGHNRWATHGKKIVSNAHPHISNDKKITLVHNGIIENYNELKLFLMEKNFKFYSETDTEVIVNLLEYYSFTKKDWDFDKIIQFVIQQIRGTFALIIFHKDYPNHLFCVRRGSPLLVGYNDKKIMIVSEQSGFSKEIEMFIVLNNDDICILKKLEERIEMNVNQHYIEKKLKYSVLPKTCHPFEHWTLKEIHEQPETILNALNHGGRIDKNRVYLGGCENYKKDILRKNHLILLGCGTSYHACLFARNIFKECCSFISISVYDGAEFDVLDIPDKETTLTIFVSQSGETIDLYNSLVLCKNENVMTFGIINVIDSLIAREVDCGIYCNAEREVGVASTKAFTSQVVCLCLLALWFSQNRDEKEENRRQIRNDLLQLSSHFATVIDTTKQQINSVYSIVKNCHNLFLLGKKTDECIAMEGSLKIKEISYIHSEGYSVSGLKHGPFALLDKNMPVILIHTQSQYESKLLGGYEEIYSRHSPIIFITPFHHLQKPNTILIPFNKTFSSLLAIVPLQFLAYRLSVDRGYNPDTPRNLAKVVTVD